MSNARLTIKKGFITGFTATIKNSETSEVVDLTPYDSVYFVMKQTGCEGVKVNAVANFVGEKTTGQVTYDFKAVDVDTAGTYKSYFYLLVSGVKKLSSPVRHFDVEIVDDLL